MLGLVLSSKWIILTSFRSANFTHCFRRAFHIYIATFLTELTNDDAGAAQVRDEVERF